MSAYGPERNQNDLGTLSLDLDSFKKIHQKRTSWLLELEKTGTKPSTSFKVQNMSDDQELLRFDSYEKELNDILLENIQNDAYIEENFNILIDLIKLTHP